MDNIEIVSKIVIPIAGILITAVLIPYIKSKTTKSQQDIIYAWVLWAVQAAEQAANLLELHSGEDKKEWVLDVVNKRGYKLSEQELDMLIESAVKDLKLVEKGWLKPEIVNVYTEDYKELGE